MNPFLPIATPFTRSQAYSQKFSTAPEASCIAHPTPIFDPDWLYV